MDIIGNLLSDLYTAIIDFIEYVFDAIFGSWSYQVLFSWLPSDIQSAVTLFILVLFGIALVNLIKHFLPF